MFRAVLVAALGGCALLSACDSGGTSAAGGVLTATLVSPNGPEGAAHVTLIGPGVVAVRALDAQTFSHARGDTVNVVVVRDQPGDLRFLVEVADTSSPPAAAILEVAGPDDRLRADLQGYRVEVRP